MENVIYLDTHIVVWLYAGKHILLSERVRKAIEKNDLLVSPAVGLELQYLFEVGKITVNSEKILKALMEDIGLKVTDYSFKSISEAAQKLSWTRDFFDRLITAEAKLNKQKLITKDRSILKNYRGAFWD